MVPERRIFASLPNDLDAGLSGLAFNSADDVLYAGHLETGSLYSLDAQTGAVLGIVDPFAPAFLHAGELPWLDLMRQERITGLGYDSCEQRVYFGRWTDASVWERGDLGAGWRARGPAIVCEYSATTVIPPGWRARTDVHGGLVLEAGRG